MLNYAKLINVYGAYITGEEIKKYNFYRNNPKFRLDKRITALFINPTDAHNYKITGMLKQLKFPQLLRHVSVHSGTIIRELFRAYLKLQLWFYCARRRAK